jgi:hypothetical protein
MVIKQLDNGKFLFWCPACNDNHVTDSDYKVSGPETAPTIAPSYYDWDDKGVCHVKISRGVMYFLPDCTHEMAEKTIPLPSLPIWMISDRFEEVALVPIEPEDDYYVPETEEDAEDLLEDVDVEVLADRMAGFKP